MFSRTAFNRAVRIGHHHGPKPLARRAHIPTIRLTQIAAGRAQATPTERRRIAAALSVPVSTLFPAVVDSDDAIR